MLVAPGNVISASQNPPVGAGTDDVGEGDVGDDVGTHDTHVGFVTHAVWPPGPSSHDVIVSVEMHILAVGLLKVLKVGNELVVVGLVVVGPVPVVVTVVGLVVVGLVVVGLEELAAADEELTVTIVIALTVIERLNPV